MRLAATPRRSTPRSLVAGAPFGRCGSVTSVNHRMPFPEAPPVFPTSSCACDDLFLVDRVLYVVYLLSNALIHGRTDQFDTNLSLLARYPHFPIARSSLHALGAVRKVIDGDELDEHELQSLTNYAADAPIHLRLAAARATVSIGGRHQTGRLTDELRRGRAGATADGLMQAVFALHDDCVLDTGRLVTQAMAAEADFMWIELEPDLLEITAVVASRCDDHERALDPARRRGVGTDRDGGALSLPRSAAVGRGAPRASQNPPGCGRCRRIRRPWRSDDDVRRVGLRAARQRRTQAPAHWLGRAHSDRGTGRKTRRRRIDQPADRPTPVDEPGNGEDPRLALPDQARHGNTKRDRRRATDARLTATTTSPPDDDRSSACHCWRRHAVGPVAADGRRARVRWVPKHDLAGFLIGDLLSIAGLGDRRRQRCRRPWSRRRRWACTMRPSRCCGARTRSGRR